MLRRKSEILDECGGEIVKTRTSCYPCTSKELALIKISGKALRYLGYLNSINYITIQPNKPVKNDHTTGFIYAIAHLLIKNRELHARIYRQYFQITKTEGTKTGRIGADSELRSDRNSMRKIDSMQYISSDKGEKNRGDMRTPMYPSSKDKEELTASEKLLNLQLYTVCKFKVGNNELITESVLSNKNQSKSDRHKHHPDVRRGSLAIEPQGFHESSRLLRERSKDKSSADDKLKSGSYNAMQNLPSDLYNAKVRRQETVHEESEESPANASPSSFRGVSRDLKGAAGFSPYFAGRNQRHNANEHLHNSSRSNLGPREMTEESDITSRRESSEVQNQDEDIRLRSKEVDPSRAQIEVMNNPNRVLNLSLGNIPKRVDSASLPQPTHNDVDEDLSAKDESENEVGNKTQANNPILKELESGENPSQNLERSPTKELNQAVRNESNEGLVQNAGSIASKRNTNPSLINVKSIGGPRNTNQRLSTYINIIPQKSTKLLEKGIAETTIGHFNFMNIDKRQQSPKNSSRQIPMIKEEHTMKGFAKKRNSAHQSTTHNLAGGLHAISARQDLFLPGYFHSSPQVSHNTPHFHIPTIRPHSPPSALLSPKKASLGQSITSHPNAISPMSPTPVASNPSPNKFFHLEAQNAENGRTEPTAEYFVCDNYNKSKGNKTAKDLAQKKDSSTNFTKDQGDKTSNKNKILDKVIGNQFILDQMKSVVKMPKLESPRLNDPYRKGANHEASFPAFEYGDFLSKLSRKFGLSERGAAKNKTFAVEQIHSQRVDTNDSESFARKKSSAFIIKKKSSLPLLKTYNLA